MKAHGWVGFSSLNIPDVISASAYSANDAVGSAFEVTTVAGARGGVLYNGTLVEYGVSRPSLRLHLFSTAFSGSVNGAPWALAWVDVSAYLGYIDINSWVSAGAGKSVADMGAPMKGMYTPLGSRSIHGQLQAVANFTGASGDVSSYRLNTHTIMD